MAEKKFIDLGVLGLYDAKIKTYIGKQIEDASHLRFQKVANLPAVADADSRTIYLVARGAAGQKTADIYDEYFLIDGAFELIGNTAVDFSQYSTTEEVNAAISVAKGQAIAAAKEYTDGLADNYATADQGGRADSAIQGLTILGQQLSKEDNTLTVAQAKTALGLGSAAYKNEGDFDAKDSAKNVKDTVDAYTVNGKKISENPVLSGADIKLTVNIEGSAPEEMTVNELGEAVVGLVTLTNDLGSKKVDKVEGSRLMTNAEGEKLAGIQAGATKVEASDVNGKIKINGVETTVFTEVAHTVHDDNYVHTDNNYTADEKSKLAGVEAGAQVNVQADWNAVSGDAYIKNKPTLGTAAAKDESYFVRSSDLVFADETDINGLFTPANA